MVMISRHVPLGGDRPEPASKILQELLQVFDGPILPLSLVVGTRPRGLFR